MATEVERKFLVAASGWREGATSTTRYRQGYLARADAVTVRVRVAGAEAWLTIKGPSEGVSRAEFEYVIPVEEAEQLLSEHCVRPLIEKTRHLVTFAGHVWEVDEFDGDNAGLVVAEVELEHADAPVELPPWAGEEVSHLPRYFNAALVSYPYCAWTPDEKTGP